MEKIRGICVAGMVGSFSLTVLSGCCGNDPALQGKDQPADWGGYTDVCCGKNESCTVEVIGVVVFIMMLMLMLMMYE